MPSDRFDAIVRAIALAAKLEGEGQYIRGKVVRAVVESLLRQEAFKFRFTSDPVELATEIDQFSNFAASNLENQPIVDTLRTSRDTLLAGAPVHYTQIPDPLVCRTCGFVAVDQPPALCPNCTAPASTFLRFNAIYWLNNLDPFESLQEFTHSSEYIQAKLQSLPTDSWNLQPSEGGWSIIEWLRHARDSQNLLYERIQRMLSEEHPSLVAKAVHEWAAQQQAESFDQLLKEFLEQRKLLLSLLNQIPLKDWWRDGIHQEFGRVTIAEQASYFASHELSHLPQLETLIRGIESFTNPG